jgi:hypothetical protein
MNNVHIGVVTDVMDYNIHGILSDITLYSKLLNSIEFRKILDEYINYILNTKIYYVRFSIAKNYSGNKIFKSVEFMSIGITDDPNIINVIDYYNKKNFKCSKENISQIYEYINANYKNVRVIEIVNKGRYNMIWIILVIIAASIGGFVIYKKVT